MLVKIGSTDITKHILTGSYSVNATDVYHKWTDANQVEHRDVVRQRVSGGFTLKFLTASDYSAFIKLVKDNKALDSSLPASLYVVNEDEQRDVKVYYKMSPGVYKNLGGRRYMAFRFEVTEK